MPTEELYNHMSPDTKSEEIDKLIAHQVSTTTGKLYILVQWHTGNSSLVEASMLQKDEPERLATFIRSMPVERSRNGYWNKWALTTISSITRAIRRTKTMYEPSLDVEDGSIRYVRTRRVLRRTAKHKNKKHFMAEPAIVLGIPVPRNPVEAAAFDRANGNTM
jgi:hypothetical protein